MSDPTRFIGARTIEALPYIGGGSVDTRHRRVQLDEEVEPGYWLFEIDGRHARALTSTDRPDLTDLPVVRGHTTDGYIVSAGSTPELLFLPPQGELPRFAPVAARRWSNGVLLYETTDFESGVEEEARRAFEERRGIAERKGVPATLRAAFGYAVLLRAGAELDIAVAPVEGRGRVQELGSDGADDIARELLRELEAERARSRVRLPRGLTGSRPATADERIRIALEAAGGALFSTRDLGGPLVEVRYLLGGERFVSVVDGRTLQVVDAGICLAGADRQITMESLPGVILEGMRRHRIEITRRF
jgi:hypothetical protein